VNQADDRASIFGDTTLFGVLNIMMLQLQVMYCYRSVSCERAIQFQRTLSYIRRTYFWQETKNNAAWSM